MKSLFLFLLLPALSFAQSKTTGSKPYPTPKDVKAQAAKPQAADGFVVNGNVEGLADGEIKLSAIQGGEVIAKGVSKNGVFALQGKLEEPGLYWLTLGKEQPQYLFLENSAIKISGKQTDIKNLKIEGSASHQDFQEFRQTFDPLFANLNAIAFQIKEAPEEKKQELMQQYNAAVAAMSNGVGAFVSSKPSSYVSLFLLAVTRQMNEDVAALEQRFHSLSDPLKSSVAGKEMEKFIAFAKVGAIGSPAIEFTQNDVNNKPISLSQFRGKYVLLDFWASWCKPCRQENPNVVKAFHRFKDKNFTVLSVSLDQQKDSWLKAIANDKLSWTHVSDLKFWNNAAAELYHVQSIPQNFLIDPAGKIIAKDLRGEDLDRKLCELLGCTN